ncbi:MAG TPA: MFS transporter [Sphingobium sp.]|uniref:MFS transporter n=1 Tax=Sphingobium sp. TaxID=1912891 RepID=UPI002ED2B5FE
MRITRGSGLFRYGVGILTAALACLQPGIDPVFLTLLSAAHGVHPADHGWIVGATQSGMALGSVIVLRFGSRLPSVAFPLSAVAALLASIATVRVEATALLLVLRGCYGLAMGVIYTHAMSRAALSRPHGAYGAVFLIQLLLSTLVALLLPRIAAAGSPALALATHSLVPLAALLMTLVSGRLGRGTGAAPLPTLDQHGKDRPDAAAWALATASLLFICTTMMVWSFTGALASAAHFSGATIGSAVAVGSIAGAATALFVMREKIIVPLPLTGLLAGLSLLSPMVAIPTGAAPLFLLSIILLNIGSTAIIIRCSGAAAARSRDPQFQRVVAFTHSGGMILGPVTGSLLTHSFGAAGLEGGAMLALAAGCGALLLAAALRKRAIGAQNRAEEAPAIP